ncbi:hypothetical protein EI94DRAFT_1808209 [Lactarius quietus]|nr:hypothetical protein EI94DRAFT_1808209 [Lactarius quietus]
MESCVALSMLLKLILVFTLLVAQRSFISPTSHTACRPIKIAVFNRHPGSVLFRLQFPLSLSLRRFSLLPPLDPFNSMTPRASLPSKRRPLSAIFLGAGSTPSPSDLPDLPEPPSPGATSTHSGLPSPPATNSTGSGSTGDSREILDRPFQPPTSSSLTMRNEKPLNSRSSRASSPTGGSESRRVDEDEEEEHTARLGLSSRRGTSQSNDHVMALQRVMSLTQRNRMALNKLSSMRLNTSSPPQSSRLSRSPTRPISSSGLASTSARSRSVDPAVLSGSETEREPAAHHSNSSDDQSITPPSTVSHALDARLRRISLPVSPSKGKVALSTRSFSPGPSQRTPKKRVSIMSMPDPEGLEHDPHDVTSAALAAVASYGGVREAVERKTGNLYPGNSSNLDERYFSVKTAHAAKSKLLPTISQANQISTMRKHQTRWTSEDLRTASARSIVDDNEDDDPPGSSNDTGIRQTVRGGSMETSLGTRLVGGSLRAAGMSVKTATDVFREPEESSTIVRPLTSMRTGSIQAQDPVASSSRESGPSRAAMLHELRTPANASSQYTLIAGRIPAPLGRDRQPPPGIRTYKSAYALDRDREGIGSRLGSATPFSAMRQERTYGSPRTRPREFPVQPLDEQAVEHLRLMDESLTMFEALLSRLPPMGDTTTATVPELFRNAQAVVRFSDQVNGMLRAGTNRALERLVDSEVSDANAANEVDMVGLWKDVGGDFRDMLRVSDELVRTMTGFLLGVGKVLRESASANANAGAGSSLQHLRGASEDLSRRSAADGRSSTSAGTGKGSARGSGSADGFGGRRSTESRRSWDPARAGGMERDKNDLLRRASSRIDVGALSGQRASSSMLLRERELPVRERTLDHQEDNSPSQAQPAARRLYTPGLQRESTPASAKPDLVTIESQGSLHVEDDYEPSPTPAPRPRQSMDESVRNKLPQLSIPAPLPALPSEAQTDRLTRRKSLAASAVTMRSNTGANPGMTITTPSAAPTTAITTLPVSRTDSGQSSTSASTTSSISAGASISNQNTHHPTNTTSGTFSRPLKVSVSALSGLSLHRHRPSSSGGGAPSSAGGGLTPVTPSSPWATSRSGSETERPPARFSLGLVGRRTIGSKSQLSAMDAAGQATAQTAAGNTARGGGGGGGVQTLARASARERRRTITEIFSS